MKRTTKKRMKLKHKSGDELKQLAGKESEEETRSVGSGKVGSQSKWKKWKKTVEVKIPSQRSASEAKSAWSFAQESHRRCFFPQTNRNNDKKNVLNRF